VKKQAPTADAALQARRTLQATERLLAAKVAHDDLIEFAQLMTPDPDEPDNVSASLYKAAPHHRMLAQALQEVESGKCLRLLISLGPQHGKSQLTSRLFPAWMIGRSPWKNLMLGSYNQDFANEFGDDVRNIMAHPAYKLVFQKSGLRLGSRAKDHMVTTRGGKLSFLGRGGAGTGRPADCVPGTSTINTEFGTTTIEKFIESGCAGTIESFDHDGYNRVWRPVIAWSDRYAEELFEITTVSGIVFRCTGNHSVYVEGRGYVQAQEITPGDALLRAVRKACNDGSLRVDEETEAGIRKHILLESVLGDCIQQKMPLRETDGEEGQEILFSQVPNNYWEDGRSSKIAVGQNLPTLRDELSTEVDQSAVLRTDVRELSALGEDEGQGEFSLQGLTQLYASVSFDGDSCTGQRREDVFCLLGGGSALACEFGKTDSAEDKFDSASHRPQPDQQQTREPDNSLFDLSRRTPQVERDTVSVVRRVRTEGVRVYDLQVEGTGNFFADEILVHNCFIVDDPIKDAKEAESPTIRKDVWEWFTKVAFTRCHSSSAICVVQTRWSEDDLIGRLTDPSNPCYDAEEAAKWTYINIPAIFTDPRDEPIAKALGIEMGQPLWPERFTIEHLASAKRLNPTGFSALYMGRPTPPEGSFYKADMLIGYSSMAELPRNMVMYGAGDLAVTPDRDSDMSCVGNWGVDSHGDLWLLPDLYWERKAADAVVDQLIDFAGSHKWMTFAVEKGPIDRAVGPFLQRRMRERGTYFHVEKFPTIGNKAGRSLSIRGRMAQGRVHFPTFARWWPAAKEQMLKFTGSGADREDDFCDQLAMIGQLMDVVMAGSKPVEKTEEKVVCIGTLRWIKQMDEYKRRQDRRHKALAGM